MFPFRNSFPPISMLESQEEEASTAGAPGRHIGARISGRFYPGLAGSSCQEGCPGQRSSSRLLDRITGRPCYPREFPRFFLALCRPPVIAHSSDGGKEGLIK